jgi:hypothetical protein
VFIALNEILTLIIELLEYLMKLLSMRLMCHLQIDFYLESWEWIKISPIQFCRGSVSAFILGLEIISYKNVFSCKLGIVAHVLATYIFDVSTIVDILLSGVMVKIVITLRWQVLDHACVALISMPFCGIFIKLLCHFGLQMESITV